MADLPQRVPITHKPATKKKSREARDYGALHQKLRPILLQLFPICQVCSNSFATIAHHLVRPATKLEHYQAVCSACHAAIHRSHSN